MLKIFLISYPIKVAIGGLQMVDRFLSPRKNHRIEAFFQTESLIVKLLQIEETVLFDDGVYWVTTGQVAVTVLIRSVKRPRR